MKMTLITLRSLTAKRSEPHPGDSKRQQESGTEFLVVKTQNMMMIRVAKSDLNSTEAYFATKN